MAKFLNNLRQTIRGAWLVTRRSLHVLRSHPQILIYPYLAVGFILVTSPIVGHVVVGLWRHVETPRLVGEVSQAAPHQLLAHLGLVGFSVFYALLVTAYFTCMISASTLAELRGQSPSLFYGLKTVLRRFDRVTTFALLAVFFFPLGVIAQRHKMKSLRGVWQAISSSFSLNMTQLAPAIMAGDRGVFATIKHAVETLGQLSKESLVIRIGTFLAILLLGSLSFLPKLIATWHFSSTTAHAVGWIITTLLGAASYIALKVISTVATTTLYHQAVSRQK